MDNFWEDNATRIVERMKRRAILESERMTPQKIVIIDSSNPPEGLKFLTPKTDTVIYNELANNFINN